jgi:hypothetical protein
MTITSELTFAEQWRADHPDDEPPYPVMRVSVQGDGSLLVVIEERDSTGFVYSAGELYLRDEIEAQELHDLLQERLGTIGCILVGGAS